MEKTITLAEAIATADQVALEHEATAKECGSSARELALERARGARDVIARLQSDADIQ